MLNPPANLPARDPEARNREACDGEPIHIIGAIQPIGVLIAIDEASGAIAFASANCEDFFQCPAAALFGRTLDDLVGKVDADHLLSRDLSPMRPELLRPRFVRIAQRGGDELALECFPHRTEGRIILEFVRAESAAAPFFEEDAVRQRIISELTRPQTMNELAKVSAEILREITGFDRVMIYRFAADRHGEVIAESTFRTDRYFGLHYPASDIPDPARRHFLLNVIRTIPDVHAEPVPILTRDGGVADVASKTPLDLTHSKLRAVAPVHVEYLGNMGVSASLSISLISNDALWGLVVCHHYAPLHLSWSRLRFCELIGGMVSALLQSLENTVQLRHSIRAEKIAFGIERAARLGRRLGPVIMDHAGVLMEQSGAAGMAFSLAGTRTVVGIVPPGQIDWAPLRSVLVDGIATSDHLTGLFDGGIDFGEIAGAAMIELSEDGEDWLILFRPEHQLTIDWAGKPEKIDRVDENGSIRLSPRRSFALWREERRARAKPFTRIDDEVLRITRRALFAINSLDRERAAVAAQAAAEAEEARLRLALLDSARHRSLGELASAVVHELNQPLSAVSNYINASRQELKNHGLPVPQHVMHLMQNAVAESSRAADLVRRLRDLIGQGKIALEPADLNSVIRQGAELALAASLYPLPQVAYAFEPDMPPVRIDPVQVAQVVLNLVRNSLAAMRNSPERRLTITTILGEAGVEVAVTDSGIGVPIAIEKTLFEPFHNSTTSGMGIGLSLCRSIVEAHGGRIWIQPVAKGTRVVFTLETREERDD